jgi:hypothetical protein
MKIQLHYNKHRVKDGLPWTLHTHKGCFAASHVVFNMFCETEEKPNRKTNPRYFLTCKKAKIRWEGTVATILPDSKSSK